MLGTDGYYELFDLAADAMFILDQHRVIREINQIAYQQLGYAKAEMLGRPIDDFILPEYIPLIKTRYAQVQSEGYLIYESAQMCRDGSILPIEICNRVIALNGQKLFFAVVRNITSRKLVQLAQEKSEHDLKRAQAIGHFGSWTHDMQGQIIWSEELYKIFGVDPETYNPNTEAFYKLIHPDDLVIMQTWNEACVAGLNPEPIEWRCIRPDGEIRYIYGHGELVLDDQGRLSHLAGTVQDITEIKNAEEALQKSEARFRLALDSLIEGCMIVGFDWSYRYLNDTAARHGLKEKTSLIGRTMLEVYPGIENSTVFAHYRLCMEKRIPQKFEESYTFDNEKTVWYLFSVEPVPEGIFVLSLDITERKMAEEIMKRHQVIINTTRDGFWLVDMQGNLLEANQAYAVMSGYSINELTQMHISQLDALNDHNDVKARIEGIIAQGEAVFETQHRRKNGGLFDVEVSVNYMAEQQQFVSFFRDITERKLDELKFRESEKKWRLLFENMTSGFALHDVICDTQDKVIDYRFLEINPAYEQLTTLKAGNIIGRTVLDVLPGTEPYWIEVFGRVATTGEPILYENYSRELGKWYQVNVFCPKKGQFAVIVSDITERKLAESAMSLYQKIINATHDGFWIVDIEGRLLEVNQVYQDMSGYSSGELINMRFTQFNALDDREKVQARIEKIMAQGHDLFETKHRHKDGHLFDVEVSVNFIPDQQKFFAFIRDISQRKKNRETLEASLEFSNNLINSMQDGFSVLDKSGYTTDANPALCRMTGFSCEELIGTSSPFPYWPPEEYENINTAFQKTLKGEVSDFELIFMHKNGHRFPVIVSPSVVKDKKGNIISYTATVKDISERKLAEEKIEHLAYHDQLTRLPNRTLLLDRLSQAVVSSMRNNWVGALLFIDLDNFKNLNDTLGHDIGDLLLKEVAHRLESCVREGDTVARLGGDEFVVMLLELNEQAIEAASQADAIGEKILTILRQPYQLGHYVHLCTASIGVTLFQGNQQSIDELMKQADLTMYQAKKAGRNALRFFDRQMQESIDARVLMENELHHALKKNQFELYYQIQVDSSLQISGAEALIRWMHPDRGMISPLHFIPLAEDTGLILPIGMWVLETACAQIKTWQQDKLTRNLTIAVNVSAKQFRQTGFVAQVSAAVKRHAINPMLLKLELTESLLQENIDETIATMNALNEEGVLFSLDDFGTGYSSLQYLKRLPLDQLKIDQSFVRDIATDASDQAIVRTIIAMAQSLDMDVIAEGVETEEQRQLLLNNGCTSFQGYLFGRPEPLAQFEALLKR